MKSLLPIASTTRWRILTATTVVSLVVLLAAPLEAQTVALFTLAAELPPPSIAADALTVRSRLASLDLPPWRPPGPGTRPGARTTPGLCPPPARPRPSTCSTGPGV